MIANETVLVERDYLERRVSILHRLNNDVAMAPSFVHSETVGGDLVSPKHQLENESEC